MTAAAASSKESSGGFRATSAAGATVWTRKVPGKPATNGFVPTQPNTASPGTRSVTSAPTASTMPAKSLPRTGARGRVHPYIGRSREGWPSVHSQSGVFTAADTTRTSTSLGP
jgi:hypothetical protein